MIPQYEAETLLRYCAALMAHIEKAQDLAYESLSDRNPIVAALVDVKVEAKVLQRRLRDRFPQAVLALLAKEEAA